MTFTVPGAAVPGLAVPGVMDPGFPAASSPAATVVFSLGVPCFRWVTGTPYLS